MEYFPDKNLKECYESLNTLHDQAHHSSQMMAADGDEDLAQMLTSMYISNHNQGIMLWHLLIRLEKKMDALLAKIDKPHKRFEI